MVGETCAIHISLVLDLWAADPLPTYGQPFFYVSIIIFCFNSGEKCTYLQKIFQYCLGQLSELRNGRILFTSFDFICRNGGISRCI